jgi:hypothetical protein
MTPFRLKRAIRRVHEAHRIKTNDDEKTKKQGAEKATVSRKVWKKDEIEQLASMREAGASWTKIHVSNSACQSRALWSCLPEKLPLSQWT